LYQGTISLVGKNDKSYSRKGEVECHREHGVVHSVDGTGG
jgi:hypothetical protein